MDLEKKFFLGGEVGAERRNSQSFQHKLKIQKHVALFPKLRCRIQQKYKQIWFVTITIKDVIISTV